MSGRIVPPSSARRVRLEGFLPVPRGSAPGPVLPPVWPSKDPGDVLDYEIDTSAALLDSEADALATVTATVLPSGELTVGTTSTMGQVAVLWLSGGIAGTIYTVQVTLGTVGGRTLARAVMLPVLALASPPAAGGPGGAALTTLAGVVVTDGYGAPILVAG